MTGEFHNFTVGLEGQIAMLRSALTEGHGLRATVGPSGTQSGRCVLASKKIGISEATK